ncbi:MAG: choice-of-anchor E domain-containing protein [Terracidiphilus sp.]
MKGIHVSSVITCSLVALVLVATTSVARADSTAVYTATVNPTQTPASSSFDISQFNTSLGTLNSITIVITDTGTTTLSATSIGSDQLSDLDAKISLALAGGGTNNTQVLIVDTGLSGAITVTPTSPYTPGPMTITGGTTEDVASANFTNFEGLGDVLFTFGATDQTQITEIGGGLSASQTTDAGEGVTVTYGYTPDDQPPAVAPEPGTLGMFGTGLLGLAALLRRKFIHSR